MGFLARRCGRRRQETSVASRPSSKLLYCRGERERERPGTAAEAVGEQSQARDGASKLYETRESCKTDGQLPGRQRQARPFLSFRHTGLPTGTGRVPTIASSHMHVPSDSVILSASANASSRPAYAGLPSRSASSLPGPAGKGHLHATAVADGTHVSQTHPHNCHWHIPLLVVSIRAGPVDQ